MKNILSLLLAAGLAASVNGGTFTNESPPGLQGMEIIWAVPTNVWPPSYKIWTYKVVPQEFSDAVISNAMTIGSFTEEEKTELPSEVPAIYKKALHFNDKDETKELIILPVLGYIEYSDEKADASLKWVVKDSLTNAVNVPAVGVPDLPEATHLALNYAKMLGIDISLLARKPHTADFDLHWIVTRRGWTDQETKKEIEETNDLGVGFTRCIDGIPVTNFGDLEVYFGNNAKVSKLRLSWRNLQPYQLNDNFIKPEQIIKSIQNGQTPLPKLAGWPLDEIKTLTITNAAPRYGRKPGDQPMDYVVPALQLDAIIDNGKTNMPIWFQTGIFPPKP